MLWVILGVLAVLTIVQLLVLGTMGGIGPFGFIRKNRIAKALVKRLLELKKKWNITVLDLWSDDAFNAISEEKRKLYMIDKIHPTKAGYRDWWGPELERQLLENLH